MPVRRRMAASSSPVSARIFFSASLSFTRS
jgi:hypothetical protein